jgi:hypothetical protein
VYGHAQLSIYFKILEYKCNQGEGEGKGREGKLHFQQLCIEVPTDHFLIFTKTEKETLGTVGSHL